MSNLPVTSLICVGEISLAIAQVLELLLLRFAFCLKVVDLLVEKLNLFRAPRSFSCCSILPCSCAKFGAGKIGVALPRVATLGVSALFRRSCATSRWS